MTQRFDSTRILLSLVALTLFAFVAAADHHEAGEAEAAPTVEEQVLGLEAMCQENADAIAARQAEKSLYDRLGGEEKIHEFVAEIVRLHGENEDFKRFMPDVDTDHLVEAVTQFIVAGSGGPAEYTGMAMPEAHEHLKLSNADFLSAGGDVMQAMKNKGHGEEEIQEIVCVLVNLRAAVVVDEDKEVGSR